MSTSSALQRRDVVGRILKQRNNGGEALVVTGVGSNTYDGYAVGDSPLTFYLWGAICGAAMIGRAASCMHRADA